MRGLGYMVVTSGLLAGLAGCGGNHSQSRSSTCAPGETRVCVGPGACQGAQACGDDGISWSVCNCGSVVADAGPGDAEQEREPEPNYVLLDDMESTAAPNGPIALSLGAADLSPGYWFDVSSTGSASNTMSPDPFAYEALASPHETMTGTESAHGAHVACLIADLYGYCQETFWFAQAASDDGPTVGVPAALARPVPYDLSAHTGIVFWGRSPVSNRVKVMIANADTDPQAGNCGQSDAATEQCWDSFSTYVTFTDTWQKFEVRFRDLQQEGWGHAAPSGTFDTTTAYLLGFQVNGPASSTAAPVTADFWVDDLYFE